MFGKDERHIGMTNKKETDIEDEDKKEDYGMKEVLDKVVEIEIFLSFFLMLGGNLMHFR